MCGSSAQSAAESITGTKPRWTRSRSAGSRSATACGTGTGSQTDKERGEKMTECHRLKNK